MKFTEKWLVCLLLLLLSPVATSFAQEEGGSFSVTPLNPETGEPQSSYYDLRVKPNEKIELQVMILNSSNKDMTIQVEANHATTNDNGVSSYLKNPVRDSSLLVAFDDLVKVENNLIIVPANSQKNAVIKVSIPKDPFKGQLLGGLRFTEVKLEENKSQAATLTNNIAYTIGVLLHQSDEKLTPEITMNKIITEQRNYRNYISVNLQNKVPQIVKEMSVYAKVFVQGTDELRYEASNDAIKMAPNSNFYFGISLEDQKFVAGNYTMKITGKADGQMFDFCRDFTISPEKANQYNRNAVFAKNNEELTPWVYVVGIGALIIIGLLLFLLVKNRRETDES